MTLVDSITLTLADDGEITLRSPREDEAVLLMAYRQRVTGETEFLGAHPDDLHDDIDAQVAFIQRANESETAICITAFGGDEIIGLLNAQRDKRRKLRHCAWFGMTVRRDHWGRGIGSALVRTMLDWAAQQDGLEKVGLSVFASNVRAIGLYRKFGFVEEGCRRRSFKLEPGRYDDEILMARFLHEAVDAV